VESGKDKKDGWEMWGELEEVWAIFVDENAPTVLQPITPPCPSPYSPSHR
jgi:hypothetical protein